MSFFYARFRNIKIISLIVAISAASVLLTTSPASAFSGSGAGTVESPFVITTCEQFQEIDDDLDASYELAATLDCISEGNDMLVSGDSTYFSGTFDGNDNAISVDLSFDNDSVGLFGYLEGGSISNLTVNGDIEGVWGVGGVVGSFEGEGVISHVTSNVNITGTRFAGGLIGRTVGETTLEISDSSATGNVSVIDGDAGGFIGSASGVSISDSHATGDVTSAGGDIVGGFVATHGGAEIVRSYATGDVTAASSDYVGGFVGYNLSTITQSYSTGNVTGANQVGGFAGIQAGGTIEDAYSRGDATGDNYVGGFVGYENASVTHVYSTGVPTGTGDNVGGFSGELAEGAEINSSLWDGESSGTASNYGDVNNKTTAQMKTQSTYTTPLSFLTVPFDFDTIWAIDGTTNDGYAFFGASEEIPDQTEASTVLTPTGKLVAIGWDSGCDISTFEVKAESVNATQDVAYEYPNGLVDFTLQDCDTDEVTITLTYVGVNNAAFVLRKYSPGTGAYTTVSDATLVATTYSTLPAIQATYVVKDNGPLDTNPAAGVISDPAGIAQGVLGAPRTGGGGTAE